MLTCWSPATCLMNNSKVIPARLYGVKEGPGGTVCEFLLLEQKEQDVWEILVHPGRRLRTGARVSFGEGKLTGEIIECLPNGNRLARFEYDGNFYNIMDEIGQMPLPHYITAELKDKNRYQTVYAKDLGSAAAPTAGLHFTNELLEKLRAKGVRTAFVTLHVGLGTFRPVKADDITDHQMHSEHYYMPPETAELIKQTKAEGGRVICVGTTSCRMLETVGSRHGVIEECEGYPDIFIYPGYKFTVMDGLITNFHLPESTLIMLVSAFAGRENVLDAYHTAVEEKYCFYSFGDAMFLR